MQALRRLVRSCEVLVDEPDADRAVADHGVVAAAVPIFQGNRGARPGVDVVVRPRFAPSGGAGGAR